MTHITHYHRYRAGVRFGCLPRLTNGGRKYPLAHVQRAYEILLAKFTAGTFKPKPVVRGIGDRLLNSVHSFREGALTEEAKTYTEERREQHREELETARREREQDLERARVTRSGRGRRGAGRGRGRGRGRRGGGRGRGRRRGRRRGRGSEVVSRDHPNLEGRRVAVPYSYFGQEGDALHGGLVGTWRKYYGQDFNEYWGYEIKFDAGDKYDLIEADVWSYLTPDGEQGLGLDEDEPDTTEPTSVNIPSSDDDSSDDWTIQEVLSERFHID